MAGRKPSRPQIILLLFQGLFIISALLHTIPLLVDILPTVISVLACTLFSCFLLLPLLRSLLLPISCQASPWRITKGIGNNQTTLPSPKNRPEFVIINHLLSSLSQLKKLDGNYFQTWLLFPISHFTVQDYLSKHCTVQVSILWPAAIFHMGNREVILTLNIWLALF